MYSGYLGKNIGSLFIKQTQMNVLYELKTSKSDMIRELCELQ